MSEFQGSLSEKIHIETPFFTLQMNIQAIGISKKMSEGLEIFFFLWLWCKKKFETQNIITERCYPLAIFNLSAIETSNLAGFLSSFYALKGQQTEEAMSPHCSAPPDVLLS